MINGPVGENAKMNFRELVIGKRVIRLVGLVHRKTPESAISPMRNFSELVEFQPQAILVETGKASLELSEFIWKDSKGMTPERFCSEHSDVNESLAIAVREEFKMDTNSVLPIDVDPLRTRLGLAKSSLLHPIESLILISRFHGKGGEVRSLEETQAWRDRFKRSCPHAFEILFTAREEHMSEEIRRLSAHVDRCAVLVGLSHVEALYDRLV
jgi:hypothetical protein